MPNEDAAPVFCDYPALGPELLDGLSRRHTRYAVMLLQLCLGRKPSPGPQLTGVDRGTQVIGDLPVRWPIVQPVDAAELHANTSSRPDVP
jgi:hypothetical protein